MSNPMIARPMKYAMVEPTEVAISPITPCDTRERIRQTIAKMNAARLRGDAMKMVPGKGISKKTHANAIQTHIALTGAFDVPVANGLVVIACLPFRLIFLLTQISALSQIDTAIHPII